MSPSLAVMLAAVAPTIAPSATLGIGCTVATVVLIGPTRDKVSVNRPAESSAIPINEGKYDERCEATTRLAAPIDKIVDKTPHMTPARTMRAARRNVPARPAATESRVGDGTVNRRPYGISGRPATDRDF